MGQIHRCHAKIALPRSVVIIAPRREGSVFMSPATVHQCRMELTMFLPTPKITGASSAVNTFGLSITASTPFFSHVYRNGKVWCPEKDGLIRYGDFECSASRRFSIHFIIPSTPENINAIILCFWWCGLVWEECCFAIGEFQ